MEDKTVRQKMLSLCSWSFQGGSTYFATKCIFFSNILDWSNDIRVYVQQQTIGKGKKEYVL